MDQKRKQKEMRNYTSFGKQNSNGGIVTNSAGRKYKTYVPAESDTKVWSRHSGCNRRLGHIYFLNHGYPPASFP